MMAPQKAFFSLLLYLGFAACAGTVRGADMAGPRAFRARDFGAVGDGRAVDTVALQTAIDACHQAGGGEVRVDAGRYVTGTLQLKDKVRLYLEEGAVLLGSLRAADYQNRDPFRDGTGAELGYALIVAVEAHHVGLAGPGTIDGRGRELAAAEGKYTLRPFLIRWVRCADITVSDVSLRGAGAWTMHFFQSTHAAVDHVTLRSAGLPNNDGIDVDSCSDVRIQNCDIDTGDDAICLKTTSALPCQAVQISHCRLKSSCAALKLGTESLGDFSDIQIEHCEILGAGLGGIKLLSVDGAHLSKVVVANVEMKNVRVPIFIRLGSRLRTFRQGDAAKLTGSIEDIVIRQVRAENCSQIGIMISGVPGHAVKNVRLEEVHLGLSGGGSRADANVVLAEKEKAYPEVKMFGDRLPASGMYLRHVYSLQATGLTFEFAHSDGRPAVTQIDVEASDLDASPAGEIVE